MRTLAATILAAVTALGAHAQESLEERASAVAERAIAYLRSQQDISGGWGVRPEGPNFPAITGLVVTGMLLDPEIDAADADAAEGLAYILSFRQPDGGIYDRVLASYNTSICLSALALAREDMPEAEASVEPAVAFLRQLQWGADRTIQGALGDEAQSVASSHPFYGGVGYGNSSRPDNSNLHFWLQALEDAGVPGDDPAVQRTLVFLERTQMDGSINTMPYAEGSMQGGLIYATSPSGEKLGEGESKGEPIEETLSDGTTASRLRAYGSMSYAGFKSFAYAGLAKTDPRVLAARRWIAQNYTLDENPGVGTDGYYYFLMVFGKALDAWGEKFVSVQKEDMVLRRDWTEDLVTKLESLQESDGSFRVVDDRWMEADPVLITSYSLIALQHARHHLETR